jgi:hypothetical protein
VLRAGHAQPVLERDTRRIDWRDGHDGPFCSGPGPPVVSAEAACRAGGTAARCVSMLDSVTRCTAAAWAAQAKPIC